MFAAALLVTWLVNLACCAGAVGYTSNPINLSWHPAYWVAEAVCLRRLDFRSTVAIGVLMFCGIVGALGWFGAIIGLFALAPLPSLILDFSRRDSKLRGVDYVFHNPLSPVTERPTTITENGRQTEIYQKIFLYIPEKDLEAMRGFMDNNEFVYLKGKRVAGALYKAAVDPDFMLVFDSLRLNRFLVHPENVVAMDAFVAALKAKPPIADDNDDSPPFVESLPIHHDDEVPEIPFGHEEPPPGSQIVDSAFATGTSQGKGGVKKPIIPKSSEGHHQASIDDLGDLNNLVPDPE